VFIRFDWAEVFVEVFYWFNLRAIQWSRILIGEFSEYLIGGEKSDMHRIVISLANIILDDFDWILSATLNDSESRSACSSRFHEAGCEVQL